MQRRWESHTRQEIKSYYGLPSSEWAIVVHQCIAGFEDLPQAPRPEFQSWWNSANIAQRLYVRL